jgi:hypothetical protein
MTLTVLLGALGLMLGLLAAYAEHRHAERARREYARARRLDITRYNR